MGPDLRRPPDDDDHGRSGRTFAQARFPDGKGDPQLGLIRVDVEQAQYWEDRQPKLLQFAEVAAALITRKPPKSGDEEKLDF